MNFTYDVTVMLIAILGFFTYFLLFKRFMDKSIIESNGVYDKYVEDTRKASDAWFYREQQKKLASPYWHWHIILAATLCFVLMVMLLAILL